MGLRWITDLVRLVWPDSLGCVNTVEFTLGVAPYWGKHGVVLMG